MTRAKAIAAAIEAEGREMLSGAVRISRAGEVLFERAYGCASRRLAVANRLQTRFHIASMTKMFIAATVVRLALDGALSLEAHPSALAPELSALDPGISLHHLLSHTSGLTDIYEVPQLRRDMDRLAGGKEAFLAYLTALPQASAPGARWRYSSTGFLLLAHVVERIAGAPFGEVVAELWLRPLGLPDTGPDDPSFVNPGRASGHSFREGEWRNTPNDPLADIDAPREFYSTVADLDRWGSALLTGEALGEAGAALSFARHARVGPGSDFDASLDYGYGWFLGADFRWIGGMTAGFRAAMWQHPLEGLTVIMLWNNERIDSWRIFRRLRPHLFDQARS